jgi:DNA invertase Pin-like site-specific DNA recombinase
MVIASDVQRAGVGLAVKLERRRIAERTARGRAEAKPKGVKFGRKPKLTPYQQRSYNVDQATILRLGT